MTLFLLSITTFGLSVIMAEVLSFGMVGIVETGSRQVVRHAEARVFRAESKKAIANRLAVQSAPLQPTVCDSGWTRCSDVCDNDYTDAVLTLQGWERCERDCDLRALRCENTNRWSEDIIIRDTKFSR